MQLPTIIRTNEMETNDKRLKRVVKKIKPHLEDSPIGRVMSLRDHKGELIVYYVGTLSVTTCGELRRIWEDECEAYENVSFVDMNKINREG